MAATSKAPARGKRGKFLGDLKKNALHNELHEPKDKKIPVAKLQSAMRAAKRNGNVTEERRIEFAENQRGWKKK